jgi:hypothetical protein
MQTAAKEVESLQGVKVMGRSVLAIVHGMEFSQSRVTKILLENGITTVKADQWYPLPAVLNSFRRIFEKVGPSTVRTIGRKIPDNAGLPPDIDTLEKSLRSLDMAYRMNHRGEGPIGSYYYQSMGSRHARIMCDNPYPCDMDQGILEGLGDKFRPKDSIRVRIEHDPRTCRLRGDTACTYDVIW